MVLLVNVDMPEKMKTIIVGKKTSESLKLFQRTLKFVKNYQLRTMKAVYVK